MSRILIFTSDMSTCNIVASAVADLADETVRTTSMQGVMQHVENEDFSLIIMASTRSLATESRLDRTIGHLHRCGIPVVLILARLSEQRATRLLQCGVDQCMTFPINLHRLRRKVHEQITGGNKAGRR